MTATGNEAVSLSQLKQWGQTLGGGSDIQRQTLTFTNGSSHTFGNWYLYYSGNTSMTADIVYQNNMILSLSVRANTTRPGNNLKLSLSRYRDEKTIYIPSVRTGQTGYLPFSTGENDTVVYAPVAVSGPSFVITLDDVISGEGNMGISSGVQTKVCLTPIFAF